MERRKTSVLALGTAICSVGNLFGSEKVGLNLASDLQSKYIWRGQNINDESVFQPSFEKHWSWHLKL